MQQILSQTTNSQASSSIPVGFVVSATPLKPSSADNNRGQRLLLTRSAQLTNHETVYKTWDAAFHKWEKFETRLQLLIPGFARLGTIITPIGDLVARSQCLIRLLHPLTHYFQPPHSEAG